MPNPNRFGSRMQYNAEIVAWYVTKNAKFDVNLQVRAGQKVWPSKPTSAAKILVLEALNPDPKYHLLAVKIKFRYWVLSRIRHEFIAI